MGIEKEILTRLATRREIEPRQNLGEVETRSIELMQAEARIQDEAATDLVRNEINKIANSVAKTKEAQVDKPKAREIMMTDLTNYFPKIAENWHIR